jgi:hypothetical protein
MKNFSHLFTITFCVISAHLFAQDKQDQIIATWQTREAHVEIYKVDERFIGNPINSEGERNQQIELLNLEYENGKWVGNIFSQKRNRSLDVVCEIEGDKLLLEVSAGRISRDLEWTRVQ